MRWEWLARMIDIWLKTYFGRTEKNITRVFEKDIKEILLSYIEARIKKELYK
ncbi:hypothetical protein BCL90_0108 [Pedobacter alluvionis]|uniref:Uncharacterized protein n=1 Tax=Pedobacter alluvionis TaxID=475253 RepID=A0A497Y8B3_9SPHI|nr:hypothetical protein BCL90_0108 [Pedobacter alluvionis]